MSAPTAASAPTAVRKAASRWQFWILLLGIGLVVALVTQLIETGDNETYGTENTDLDGYAALNAVLDDHGVEVQRVYSAQAARELMAREPDAGVVVLLRGFLPEDRFSEELAAEWEDGREVLWISEQTWLLTEVLDGEVSAGPRLPVGSAGAEETVEAGTGCEHPAAQTAESLRASGASLHTGSGCFPVGEDAFVLSETSHGLMFTAPEAFTNQNITEQGNAALALGLLGAGTDSAGADSVIWYTPSGADTVGADQWGSPLDYLPGWFWPLVWWLLLCAAVALLAAGRRYGPVVSEPVPVVVPAAEATVGRGRLYQRANAVAETAEVLRSAHLLRLSRLLRLGRGAEAGQIAEAAARATGEDVSVVTEPARVSTNDDLVTFAQTLAGLEDKVTRAVRMQRSSE